ncbi:MAG TPA: hypothetical protein VJB82_00040 [Candidatus Peribacterales bacterium]|nr:hypothetical protein [Candidatus Peribacterales bacterium]
MTLHHQLLLLICFLAGFSLAFAFLFALTITVPLVGELLQAPSLDLAKQNEEFRQVTVAMGSFWFWIGVTAIGTFFTAELWKWMRG